MFIIQMPALTVGNGTNPGNANAYRGSSNNALDAFTLSANGTASVSALTVSGSANFNATNIPTNGVKIYRDAGTIGTLDGADTLISSGSTAIAGNATTVTLTAAENVTTTVANYLVVVDINQGATATNTFTANISAVTGTGFGATTDNDGASATLTVTASALTAGNGTNPANYNVARSTTNNAIDGFTLQLNGGSGTVTSLTVLGSASFTATNVPTNGVKIWRDLGTVGVLDGADVQISTASSAINTNATTVTISNEPVTTTAANYLVTVDITAGATIGNSFTATISNAAGTNLGTLTDNDTGSATLTIVTPTLTIGNGTNPANANAAAGSTGNELNSFTLQMNAGSGTVTSLAVAGSANFNTTNIPTNGVKIYRDAGTIGTLDGADTLISSGSSAIAGQATTVTLTAAETVTTTAANYLVVVDLNFGATVGNTFTGNISGATGTGLGTPVDNDGASATLTVTACVDPDPSTISVKSGQALSGNVYNVSGMLNAATGDVGTFEYKVTQSAAAAKTYNMRQSSGTALNGFTTNLTACGTNFTTQIITPMSSTAGTNACTTGRTGSTGAVGTSMLLVISDTTYANPTVVTGVDVTGNLRDYQEATNPGSTVGVRYELGYVSGGVFTAFGFVDEARDYDTQTDWTTSLAAISGTAPAGSRLAVRVSKRNPNLTEYRFYFTATSLVLNVNELVTTTCTDWTTNASIPATAAGGALCGDYVSGGTYYTDIRGTDPDCGGNIVASTNGPQAFTWTPCSELTPSSITANGMTTASGAFNGSSLFTLTDVVNPEYRVVETIPAAGVQPLNAWTNLYSGAPNNISGTINAGNITLSAGSERLLMVGVCLEVGTGNTTANTLNATVGGQSLALIGTTGATSAREHCYMGYLKESTLPATWPAAVSVNYALGANTVTGIHVKWGSYKGVDQTAPINSSSARATALTNATFNATINYLNKGLTLFIAGNGGTPADVTAPPTDFTTSALTQTSAHSTTLGQTAQHTAAGSYANTTTVTFAGTTSTRTGLVVASLTPSSNTSEVEKLAWNADPQEASGVLTNGNTYTIFARGTDPECSKSIYAGGTPNPGTGKTFTWSACNETLTLTGIALSPSASPITGAVTVTANGTATSKEVRWSTNGGSTWSAWTASGATFTPATCTSGNVIFAARGNGACPGNVLTYTTAAMPYNTTDAGLNDLAVITVTTTETPDPLVAKGMVTIRATVTGEANPETMQNMVVNISGSTACNLTNGVMTYVGAGIWEYANWDTSACGGPAPTPVDTGVILQVSGTDPDCNDFVTGSATVVIDNQCTDATSTVSWTPPGTSVTTPLVVTAVLSGGTAGSAQVSFDDGATWLANGSTFTPTLHTSGTSLFRVRALDTCGRYIYGGPYTVNWDGQVALLKTISATATAAGKTSINVRFRYTSDINNNGQVTLKYRVSPSGAWTTVGFAIDGKIDAGTFLPGQVADADGVRNKYVQFLLNGLPTDTTYDLEITVTDPDGIDATTLPLPWTASVALTSWLDSPLLHNALRFACSKIGYTNQTDCETAGGTWNLDRKWAGGWGLPNATYPNAQYESFECGTCHEKNSSNVKRVITAVTPKADGPFPGSTVNLQDVREGTAEYGDDSDNHTTSNRACEVCHSKTTYHRADTTLQTNRMHNNKTDCIRCHEHNVGFRASCDSCHGTPPVSAAGMATQPATTGSTVWGEHQKHAVDLGYDCNTCHGGWDGAEQMPSVAVPGSINIGIKPSVNPQFTGALKPIDVSNSYEGRATPGGKYTAAAGTTLTQDTAATDMSCAVYCHGYGRPVWNPASSQPCGSCHGGVGTGVGYRAGAPTGLTTLVSGTPVQSKDLAGLTSGLQVGKHANHLDDSVYQTGDPCALCHDGFSYTDATHVNGTVNVKLRQAVKLSSPGTTGGAGLTATYNADRSCTTECHGPTKWNSTEVLNCTQSCHNYPPVGITAGYSTYSNPDIKSVNHTTPNGIQYLKDNHGQCLYCHGWNDNGSGALPITGMTAAQLTAMNGDPAEAPNFSTYSNPDNLNGQHMDGAITLNDDGDLNPANDADYDPATGGCDNAVCHGNDTAHQFNISGGNSPLLPADIGPGDCGACHTTGVGGATIVTSASSHTRATLTSGFTGCTACHSGHYTKAGGVKIPNNPAVGINYVGTQHGGINLGGPGTHPSIENKTTEAEICWGCHDALGSASVRKNTITFTTNTIVDSGSGLGVFTVGKPLKVMGSSVVANNKWVTPTAVAAGTLTFAAGTFTADATAGEMVSLQDFVSEWGGNTPQTGTPAQAQYQYNYGSLSASNWTTATWTSGQAKFGYKTGKIQSTHAANSIEAGATSTVTGSAYAYKETVDNVALIRCTYCHDVHNAVGPNGPPYLRGTWWGNPYEEDGAPQAATAYSNTAPFGAVPRGNGANQSYIGGFFIDINNVRPGSAGATANGVASANPTATGGTGTGGAWTLADSAGLCILCHGNNPSTMNWNTTETNLWFSANGHANAVIGGTGNVPAGTAANVFNLRGGTASTTGATNSPAMHYWGGSTTAGVAPGDVGAYGFRNGGNSQYNYTPSLSSVSENNEQTTPGTNRWGTINIDANTINSQYHKFSCSKCHNPHASRLPKLMITNCLDTKHNTWDDSYQLNAATGINQNRSISNWSTAQNCHRVGGIIPANRLIPADSTTGGPTGNGLYAEPVDTGAVGATMGTGTDYSNRGWNTVTPW